MVAMQVGGGSPAWPPRRWGAPGGRSGAAFPESQVRPANDNNGVSIRKWKTMTTMYSPVKALYGADNQLNPRWQDPSKPRFLSIWQVVPRDQDINLYIVRTEVEEQETLW